MKKQLVFIITSLTLLAACSKNNSSTDNRYTPSCSGTKSFASDVRPLIASSCALSGCHAGGSTNGVGPLTNYTEVFNARFSIRDAVATGAMPQNSSLTNAQKDIIMCWIDGGAPNN